MNDQASELRQLVQRDAVQRAEGAEDASRLVVVAGGKGGVGTTTLTVNLAVALQQQGSRCLLVDADVGKADATTLCGLNPPFKLTHVLSGWRTVQEAMLPGPGGVRVLGSAWAEDESPAWSAAAQQRLVAELRGLRSQIDTVIIDAGSGLDAVARRFWQTADTVLLVTTPDSVSVMDAYAAIKVMTEEGHPPRVQTVVNRATDQAAAEVHDRLAQACGRFLGLQIAALGHLPDEPRLAGLLETGEAAAEVRPQVGKMARALLAAREAPPPCPLGA